MEFQVGRGGSSLCVLGEEYPPGGMKVGVPDKQECVGPLEPYCGQVTPKKPYWSSVRTPGVNGGARS